MRRLFPTSDRKRIALAVVVVGLILLFAGVFVAFATSNAIVLLGAVLVAITVAAAWHILTSKGRRRGE